MTTDLSTGLPELPKGHFWRIKKSGYPYAEIQIRKQGKIFSRKICRAVMYQSDLIYSHKIVRFASLALSLLEEKRTSTSGSVYGDYPPKKLGE